MRKAVIAISLFALSLQGMAQSGFGISRIAYGTEKAAKGFAGVASSEETAWAVFSNIAAVPFSDTHLDTELSYQNWAPDYVKSNCYGFAGSYNIAGKFGVGLGFVSRKGEEITDATDENGMALDDFTPSDFMFDIGLAYRPLRWLSLGVSIETLSRKLYVNEKLSAFSVNVFAMAQHGDLSAAVGVSKVGSADEYKLPSSLTIGLDYSHEFVGNHGVSADIDLDTFFEEGVSVAVGAEYSFRKLAFVRGGYHYGSDDAVLPSFATLGLGIRLNGLKLSFSYLLGSDYLDGTMTLGLGYRF